MKAPFYKIISIFTFSTLVLLTGCVANDESQLHVRHVFDKRITPQSNGFAFSIMTEFIENPEDLAEGETRIALKTLHINRCPAIAPIATVKGQETRLGLDMEKCMAHLRQLQTASGVVEKIQDAISQGGFEQHDDPDLMLYQGEFFSASDKQVMTELRNSAPVDLMRFSQSFQDNRLPEMLTRYRTRNFPSELDKVEQESWNDYRMSVWQGDTARRRVLDRISALKSEGRGEAALDDLEQYVFAVTDWL